MKKANFTLSHILDDEFLGTLAKSADLYKIGSNSVLDPEEIRIGLKVVPRAVMAMLISELVPMEINAHKDIQLPFGIEAYIRLNKNAADDYTGSIYSDKKLVYDFKNRSIPGLGIIILSTFELYDLETLKEHRKEVEREEPSLDNVQKLINERMEMHMLVSKVVEHKLAEREAIQKLMMDKLSQIMTAPKPAMSAQSPKIISPISPSVPVIEKPIDVTPKDIVKKEEVKKKGSPLKDFVARKKKPIEYSVHMGKSEDIKCEDCNQAIFKSGSFSGCVCLGNNDSNKVWFKKSQDGNVKVRFSKNWDPENIELLLNTLRRNNE
jgi:hypothetical protein